MQIYSEKTVCNDLLAVWFRCLENVNQRLLLAKRSFWSSKTQKNTKFGKKRQRRLQMEFCEVLVTAGKFWTCSFCLHRALSKVISSTCVVLIRKLHCYGRARSRSTWIFRVPDAKIGSTFFWFLTVGTFCAWSKSFPEATSAQECSESELFGLFYNTLLASFHVAEFEHPPTILGVNYGPSQRLNISKNQRNSRVLLRVKGEWKIQEKIQKY